MEELQARHRKEQRDLQSRITQKKKQASKKTRKGVNDECDRLEADLRDKQQTELDAFNGVTPDVGKTQEELDALTLAVDDDASNPPNTTESQDSPATNTLQPTSKDEIIQAAIDAGEPIIPSQLRKPNRQKARLARRAADQEEASRLAALEAANLPDLKEQERDRMLAAMKERGLVEKEIRADGHCLYSAVADQLIQNEISLDNVKQQSGAHEDEVDGEDRMPYKVTRNVAARYIEEHKDDFEPFLEEPLQDYLYKIRETGEWGGQLELMALAKSYGIDINVLQDFGRVEKIEAGKKREDGKAIWLGYYKHGFGLGEHYNSLRRPNS